MSPGRHRHALYSVPLGPCSGSQVRCSPFLQSADILGYPSGHRLGGFGWLFHLWRPVLSCRAAHIWWSNAGRPIDPPAIAPRISAAFSAMEPLGRHQTGYHLAHWNACTMVGLYVVSAWWWLESCPVGRHVVSKQHSVCTVERRQCFFCLCLDAVGSSNLCGMRCNRRRRSVVEAFPAACQLS